jgi:phosphotransferase system enzyme I (PtsI)
MADLRRLKATSASPGFASGPAYLAQQQNAPPAPRQGTTSAKEALAEAIETAIGELQSLTGSESAEGRDIIDFQVEVLRDPTIMEMTGARIAAGMNAAFAWVGTLDGYIHELEAAEEEHLRARAIDILDVKNRVLGVLTGIRVENFPAGSIFVGGDMEPSRFLAHDWSAGGGVALFNGSAVGHVALLARARSIPMVVGSGPFGIAEGCRIGVDGDAGAIILGGVLEPSLSALPDRAEVSRRNVGTADGGEVHTADGVPVRVMINLNDPDELDFIDPATIAGIGLMRSEFAVTSIADAANEETQLAIYRHVLEWAAGKPVTIRMLDIGGDKALAGLDEPGSRSAMGLRGIRLLLARPEIARVQARALLRAATSGDLRVMLPMVTFPSEVDAMRQMFREEAAQFQRRSVPHRIPPIGMMVEVPAAALMLDAFATADFFSFGTNDLAQYLAAAARDSSDFATYGDRARPAVLRLLSQATKLAGARPVSICGDMASDPRRLPELLAVGLGHFSVAPAQLHAIRSAIVGLNADGTKAAGE